VSCRTGRAAGPGRWQVVRLGFTSADRSRRDAVWTSAHEPKHQKAVNFMLTMLINGCILM
jgi:hypothetical protein